MGRPDSGAHMRPLVAAVWHKDWGVARVKVGDQDAGDNLVRAGDDGVDRADN